MSVLVMNQQLHSHCREQSRLGRLTRGGGRGTVHFVQKVIESRGNASARPWRDFVSYSLGCSSA